MELKNLHHAINTHLKENSLAEAIFSDGIIEDSVIVHHPKHPNASYITITKEIGCWHLEFEKSKDSGVVIEMKIEIGDDNEDIAEIIDFVNSHTQHLISVGVMPQQ